MARYQGTGFAAGRISALLVTTALSLGIAAPAFAQADQPAADTTTGNDIVVTAQFQAQNLQDTPLAITAQTGEMLEARREEMIDVHVRLGGPKDLVAAAVDTSVDRLVYYAGWADKYEQVLGNVNPVASPHFNFTVTEPMGVIGVIAPDLPPLLPLISLIAPAIVSGNTVVALASEKVPYPAILFGEMLATSDLPGGVVNLLTGFRKELVPTFATHTHLRAIVAAVGPEDRKALQLGAAESVKRTRFVDPATKWLEDTAQSAYAIRDTLEFKTTWHPIGA